MSAIAAEECTRVACFLAEKGGLVSFPLITIAGLVDGINPCAIGMMVLLLGYLLVFAKEKNKGSDKRVLLIGSIYILTVFVTYISLGLLFYSSISTLPLDIFRGWFNKVLAAVLLVAGMIQLKDFFKPEWPIHLRIPGASKKALMPLIEKGTVPTTILLGVLVTLLETPCSLPIYVGTAAILAQSGLPLYAIIAYFLYYNFLFVLPLIVVLVVVWRVRKIISLKEWEHKAEKWMKLAIGLVLMGMAAWLLR